jgi:tRNA nucleotidyltransferase (CCA-adding enzyme)
MQVYCVGGAVRDELLGQPVRDRDWVVVGTTPAQLTALGYLPVGRDFPVFLHPQTREEYALARTERKSGKGYRGFVVHFAPDVSLEDDLRRRDLTINAMARDSEGNLIDPWNGQRDLQDRILRHVSEAFGEDPVRILRVARFAARFADFGIAPETAALMRSMVEAGEADHLVPERVWQELSRGLMEDHPSRMIAVLRHCGALARVLPELDRVWNPAMDRTLDACASASGELEVRFAVLLHGIESAERVDALARNMRAPVDCRDLARIVCAELPVLEIADKLDPEGLVVLVERIDGLRRPQRLSQVLRTSAIIDPNPALQRVADAARRMAELDAGAIARAGSSETIRQRLHEARVAAVRGLG